MNIVGGVHQRRLLKYLFEDNKYDPTERPVLNDSSTLAVSMSLALQQIIDFVSFSKFETMFYLYLFHRMKKMKFFQLVVG